MTVNDTKNTGIQLQVNGVSSGSEVKVSLTQLTAPSQGQGQVQLSGGGTVKYYDVKVVASSNSGTSQVCFTDPSVNASSQLAYYNGNSWVVLSSTVNGTTICAQVQVSALGGTNFAVGAGFVAVQAILTSTIYGSSTPSSTQSGGGGGIPEFPVQLSAAFFLTVVVIAAYLATRQRTIASGRTLS